MQEDKNNCLTTQVFLRFVQLKFKPYELFLFLRFQLNKRQILLTSLGALETALQFCRNPCLHRSNVLSLYTIQAWQTCNIAVLASGVQHHITTGHFYLQGHDHHHNSSYPLSQTNLQLFFLVMGAFKIYSLGNFPICATTLPTPVTTLHTASARPIYFISASLQTPPLW